MLAAPRHSKSRLLLGTSGQARAQTDKLFEIVKPESLYDRPIPERHRIIFYIGHLEAFDWNLLRAAIQRAPFDAESGPAVRVRHRSGGRRAAVRSAFGLARAASKSAGYAARVREALDSAVAERRVPEMLLNTAIEHRLMHAETLAYMLHQLPLEKKIRQTAGRCA